MIFFCQIGKKERKNSFARFDKAIKLLAYNNNYSVFQGFSKAKSVNGGSILSLSQFLKLLKKIKLASKVVKVDSKIIISLPKI